MKSIFSSPVDKYFIGKMAFGLISIFSFCGAFLAVLAIVGTYKPHQGYIAKSPALTLVFYSLVLLIGLIGFAVVEKKRKNHLNSKDIK